MSKLENGFFSLKPDCAITALTSQLDLIQTSCIQNNRNGTTVNNLKKCEESIVQVRLKLIGIGAANG
jgi:hypothetical protein